jgi:hypothetical protein
MAARWDWSDSGDKSAADACLATLAQGAHPVCASAHYAYNYFHEKLMNALIRSQFLVSALILATLGSAKISSPSKEVAQSSSTNKANGGALNLPNETAIVAKLMSDLDTRRIELGAQVEAQVTDDVKVDKQTVLKRGSRLVGVVCKLQVAPKAGELYGVGIEFVSAASKTSGVYSLHTIIKAIGPPANAGQNGITDLPYDGGGHATADQGAVPELTADSRGPVGLPDIDLGTEVGGGKEVSVMTSKKGAIQLRKGTQLIFQVVNP